MAITTAILSEKNTNSIIFDLLALIVITLTPALSHMFSVPLYMLEPMRVMLVLSLVHTSKRNAYILAMLLPLFSYLISTNPLMPKMFLIGSELIINVWLFSLLKKKVNNNFITMFLSILLSKIYYYLVKFGLITAGLLHGSTVDTPIYLQVLVVSILSFYALLIIRRKKSV